MSESVEIQIDEHAFAMLENLLTGKTRDVQSVATTLGVTRDDFSRALSRSLTNRPESFSLGPLLERLGIPSAEFVSFASLHNQDLPSPRLDDALAALARLKEEAPDNPRVERLPHYSQTIEAGAFTLNRTMLPAINEVDVTLPAADEHGWVLGRRYEIIEQLGKGGQATVYRVFDLALRRPAALKLFHLHVPKKKDNDPPSVVSDWATRSRPVTAAPERESSQGIDPLTRREVELLCGPACQVGVLRLLDWGCDGDRPFLVFPLCVSDLARRRKETGTLEARQAASWVLEVAEALERLHAADIVHTDVKPHNLLLEDNGRVFLTDLGMARVAGDVAPNHLMGSLSYMSPEQICVQPLNAQSDIYSLGVTLYELLAGRAPFTIARLDRDDIETLRRRVLFEEPPALPDTIPPALQAICTRAISRNTTDRFQTISEFRRSLQYWLFPGWRFIIESARRRILLEDPPPNPVGMPDGKRAFRWRQPIQAVTAWFVAVSRWQCAFFGRRPRERESASTTDPAQADFEALESDDPVNKADHLRYRLLACAEAADWKQVRQILVPALDAHNRIGDPAMSAQFLWDACRICARAGDRLQAIQFALMARDAFRDLGSPMTEFVSSLLAEWKAAE